MNLTQNAFVQSSTVDNFGRRTYQTVNANGVYYLGLNSSYSISITKAKLNLNFGPSLTANRNIDFINGVKDISTTNSYGMRVGVNKYVQNKYNFYLSPYFYWNHSKASVNSSANADYWSVSGYGSANVNLPHKFEVATDLNLQIRQKDPRFSKNSNYTTWNASIIKRFMKNNDMELKLGLYDILNQNKGYNRNFNSYSFTESYYATLRRFWLLTLTWNISKNGKPMNFN